MQEDADKCFVGDTVEILCIFDISYFCL